MAFEKKNMSVVLTHVLTGFTLYNLHHHTRNTGGGVETSGYLSITRSTSNRG